MDRTSAGIALALESAQMLMSPEVAAELERLRARVSELEARIATALAPHVQYEDSAHCQADGEPWPCLVTTALTGPDRVQRLADKLTAFFAPTQALREPVECKGCGAPPSRWCPDCAACEADCYSHRSRSSCAHSRAPWGEA
ncbi:hypothetical protein [Streptomyces sp. NPDC052114]|uniref:hypothetical protein n=1 Tax=unclassified Streptomyces TaxID=2593676 RepID=UPI00342DAD0C